MTSSCKVTIATLPSSPSLHSVGYHPDNAIMAHDFYMLAGTASRPASRIGFIGASSTTWTPHVSAAYTVSRAQDWPRVALALMHSVRDGNATYSNASPWRGNAYPPTDRVTSLHL